MLRWALIKGNITERIKETSILMLKGDFLKAFPETIPRGAKKYDAGIVEVREVAVAHYSFYATVETNRNVWTGMEGRPQ